MGKVSPETLLEAHKATIRGKLIQLASQIHRSRRLDIDKLEGKFQSLSKRHKRDSQSISTDKLDEVHTALNLALASRAEKSLRWSGAQFYYQIDRAGSMLVARLSPNTLAKIKISGGTLSHNLQRIMEAFHKFYKSFTPLTKTLIAPCGILS